MVTEGGLPGPIGRLGRTASRAPVVDLARRRRVCARRRRCRDHLRRRAGGRGGFSDGSRVPGIILCLVVAAGGYALLHWFPESPAATAGVTAIALAVPPFFYFLTFDADGTPPWSAEGILALSALVWLVSYVLGPVWGSSVAAGRRVGGGGAAGVPVHGGAVSAGFEETIVDESPFATDDPFTGDDEFTGQGDEPDLTTLGIISLVFGAAYLVAAHLLDRRGSPGPQPCSSRRPRVHTCRDRLPRRGPRGGGAPAAAIVAGLLVAWLGARSGRRASTVIGAGGVALGIVLIIADAMQEAVPRASGSRAGRGRVALRRPAPAHADR